MLLERSQQIMGTSIGLHVAYPEAQEPAAHEAVDACFAWLREVDRCLTRFDPSSELCQLNARAGEWTHVSDMLYAVLEESLEAARASDGFFDPALLTTLERLGYDRDINLVLQTEDENAETFMPVADKKMHAASWREIGLDPSAKRVMLPIGIRLDLGGIAKGWAADVALERFFRDFDGALIDLGGDMRASGRDERGEPWPLGVRDPRASDAAAHTIVFSLAAGGVACSGALDRWWWHGGERRHHLIDPRTGEPMRLWLDKADDTLGADELIATVTALAPTGAQAEVAAKVALLRGYPMALRAVETAWYDGTPGARYGDAQTALILVMGDGSVYCSKNVREWLTTCGGGGELWLD